MYLQEKVSCMNCNLLFKFQNQNTFRQALPIFRHSGRVGDQSVDWISIYHENKSFPRTTDGQTDGRTKVAYDNNTFFFDERKKY